MTVASEAIVDRLQSRYPVLIDLSLGRLAALLERLGNPERALPPVIHVAGTNGKGSTTAFLRAIAEGSGLSVHATTSPHLVSITERYRIAGRLVSEAALSEVFDVVDRADPDATVTVFEAMIAGAFLLFSRHSADLALIEVGLGGTFDATNLLPAPRVVAITSISMDHEAFLGDNLEAIAGEKAGIIKPGVAVVTGRQQPSVMRVLENRANSCDASLWARDREWAIEEDATGLRYTDPAGCLSLPSPSLLGRHQIDNAGIAVAAMRRSGLAIPATAWRAIAEADWPARLQRLKGILAASLPDGFELWLDGGHNPGAGEALAEFFARHWTDRPLHLLVGLKQTKDAAGFVRPLLPFTASAWAISEPGQHFAMSTDAIISASGGGMQPGRDTRTALARIAASEPAGRVLICGSLYLAGEILKLDSPTRQAI